ncbi:MAG: diphthamide biosynthesis enzyme Dph2 [Nitrososphaeria archaeon]
MLDIDKDSLVKLLKEKKPKLVLVSCPSGILVKCMAFMTSIAKEYGFKVVFLGEPCYGTCDLGEYNAHLLGADLSIHIGHSASMKKVGELTYLIEAFDDVNLIPVLEKALLKLKDYKRLGLCTIGPHIHKLDSAKNFLISNGFEVFIGDENPPLKRGQIFGCNFATCTNISSKVDAFIFIGSSRFHASGLYNCIEKPVYMLDPYTLEVLSIEKEALRIRKHQLLNFYRALDAKDLGIIIGTKEGQFKKDDAFHLYNELSQIGKNVFLIAMGEITNDKLNEFQNIEAFIETACPRISDDHFDKPLLSLDYGYKLLEQFKKY